MEKIRLAQIKVYPVKGDLDTNQSRLLEILREVEPFKPDVVITPECFLDGYVSTETFVTRDNIGDYAIDPNKSPYVDAISEWAARNNSWFIYGSTRLSEGGVYNSALIINRLGDRVGIYDKVHCQNHDEKYLPGKSLPVFQSDFGLFGVMICADRRWPETVRSLALKGARIIFNPTYGAHDTLNEHMMQTRSYESEIFITFTHPEQSLVTGPGGEIINNEKSADVNFAITEIDLAKSDRAREKVLAHLKDRRPDIYSL